MFRPIAVPLSLCVVCAGLLAGCATAEQAPTSNGGDPDGGTSAQGGSGGASQAGTSASTGGKPGAGGSPGTSGTTGSSGATQGGASGSAGSSGTGGAHAGGTAAGGAATGGTSAAGGASAGATSTAGTSAGGASAGATSMGGAGSAGAPSGGASGTMLFSDDFEDSSTSKWVTSGGTWAIVTDGTKAYAQTATGTGSSVLLSAAGSTTWTDQIVEAKVKVTAFGGASTSYYAAIFARYNGTDYYSVLLRSDGKLVIRKDTSSIGNAVSVGIVAGTWYTVRLECIGSTIKAYLNGVLQSTVTDATISSGGMAVSVDNATAVFDDVKVTKP